MAKTNAGNFHRIHKNIFNQIEIKKYKSNIRKFSEHFQQSIVGLWRPVIGC